MRGALRMVCVAAWGALCAAGPAIAQSDDRSRIVRFLEDQLSDSARQVQIEGFRGALSAQAQLDRLTISDAAGAWLILEDAQLDWQRSALLSGRVEVQALSASRLTVLRIPEPSGDPALPDAEARPFSLPDLPVAITIDRLAIDEIVLEAAVMGLAGRFSLDGSLDLANGDGDADLEIVRLDQTRDRFDLSAAYSNATEELAVDLSLTEAPGGVVSELLNLPGRPSVAFEIAGTGPLDQFAAQIQLATGRSG